MHVNKHAITTEDSNASFQLTSFHFGDKGQGKKVYIQAALHADEVPGMLVSQFLKEELGKLENEGRILGEIILVPAANPIGLSQAIHGAPFGRFDLSTGVNFNRAYKHVAKDLKASLEGKLGSDPVLNIAMVREHARHSVAAWEPRTNAEVLKKTLLGMAIDADYVLDLHCDNEAVIHIYTGTPLLEAIKPLAAIMGAHAVLVSLEAGGEPFDEACSSLWWELSRHFGPAYPIPPSCVSTTIELRGEMDVSYDYANKDANGLLQYLAHQGILDIPKEALPAPLCEATPLEGVEPISAPHAGILVFLKKLGDRVEAGETVADLIDPVSGKKSHLRAETSGVFFASTAHRHLLRGMQVGKIASPVAYRSGSLLSA